MSDTVHKIKIWTKLIVLGVLILFVAIFCLENYSNSALVWLFGTHQTTVLELLAVTFFCGVVAAVLARPAWRTVCQIKELTRKSAAPSTGSASPAVPPPGGSAAAKP